jgi:hypothetical protein
MIYERRALQRRLNELRGVIGDILERFPISLHRIRRW